MTDEQRRNNHPGEEHFLTEPGDSDAVDERTDEIRKAGDRDRGLGTAIPPEEKKDSGFFGAGSNEGIGDDNLARETEPGYQGDKWDRGTIMPR